MSKSFKLKKIALYDMVGSETPIIIKIKKWSVGKFYSMVEIISEVMQKLELNYSDLSELKSAQLGRMIGQASQAAQSQLTHIIKESIVDPKLTEEQILEWDAEDYVGVLSEILSLNLTDHLAKNLTSLRVTFLPKK